MLDCLPAFLCNLHFHPFDKNNKNVIHKHSKHSANYTLYIIHPFAKTYEIIIVLDSELSSPKPFKGLKKKKLPVKGCIF